MRSSVDEVGHRHQCSTDANDWAIERGYEDLPMGIERLCDVQIVRSEGLKQVLELLISGSVGLAGNGDIGASEVHQWMFAMTRYSSHLRAEETACACEDSDKHIIPSVNMSEALAEVQEEILAERSELLRLVDLDYCYSSVDFKNDLIDLLRCLIHDWSSKR